MEDSDSCSMKSILVKEFYHEKNPASLILCITPIIRFCSWDSGSGRRSITTIVWSRLHIILAYVLLHIHTIIGLSVYVLIIMSPACWFDRLGGMGCE